VIRKPPDVASAARKSVPPWRATGIECRIFDEANARASASAGRDRTCADAPPRKKMIHFGSEVFGGIIRRAGHSK
jgi:hypothetical protein